MILVKSLLFQIYFFASTIIFASVIVICSVFDYEKRFMIARMWANGMLSAGKIFCGLDYIIEGIENIPSKPSVIMIKHSTVFEAYAQLAVFPRQTWVVKRELLWIPIFGWCLQALKAIAINRKSGHTAVNQIIKQGKKRLNENIWITIFPEGTRVAKGETKRYGISGAILAKEAGTQIIPVAHNAGDFWPRRGLLKRPGLIRFCIGSPIETKNLSPKEITLVVQNWIESKMNEISHC